MRKKKNNKKASKNVVHPDPRLTVKQLCMKGSQLLSLGNAREALSFFKQVERKTGRNHEVDKYLFSAFLLHHKQLFDKGFVSESAAIKKQVCEYFPGIDKISEEQMAAYLKCCSGEEAFHAYQYYITKNGLSPVLERTLADLILQKQCWSNLDGFDATVPLKRDSEAIKQALPMMEEGKWEHARDVLGSITRQSPFASVRMFCRAIAAFYEEDDITFRRAASLIHEDFLLKPLLDNLAVAMTEAGDNGKRSKVWQHLYCLFEGPVMAESQVRDLLFELNHRNTAGCAEKIKKLAASIYPKDVDAAIMEIITIIWRSFSDNGHYENPLSKLIKKLLPKDKADLMIAKSVFLQSAKRLSDVGAYLALLPVEFPNRREQDIAHALILQSTVSATLNRNGGSVESLFEGRQTWFPYANLLGIRSTDRDMMMVEILRESIRLDPDNRSGYELISRLSINSKEAKKAVEEILSAMMKRFADDPYPCLELADIYYGKNAFRKAENLLRIAMERAPHDNRVLDRHALALLISADKNIHLERYHLSWSDLEKVQQLKRKKHAVLLAAKRATHRNLAENELIEKAIDLETLNFSTVDYLRTLAVILADWTNNAFKNHAVVLSVLTKLFKKRIRQVSQMTSEEIKALLAPIDTQYRVLLPDFSMAGLCTRYNPKICRGLNDEDFISVIDQVLDHSLLTTFSLQLQNRIKNVTGLKSKVFEFYLTVIRYMNNEIKGSAPFSDLVTGASASEHRQLIDASRRLALHACGILQMALQKFDFGILDSAFPDTRLMQMLDALDQFEDQKDQPSSIHELFKH
ncbi:MAG: hypothetical protein MUD09_08635, partial [Desulfobacterales bacterium]|nr:hypothetical protein [Desulfobacterales bacterium]